MRAGVLISGVSHVVLVALALLGTPKLFDNPQLGAIEIELVRPEEAEPKEKSLEEKPKDNKPVTFDPFSPKPADPPSQAAAQAQPKQPAVPPSQQAMGPQVPSPAPTPPQPSTPWIFDPVNIPALLNMPNAPESGFDAAAIAIANLSGDDKAAFKAHLKICWRLPDGMTSAQTTRVVLRIFLKPDGRLASEPLLIEASASRDGPLLLKAAIRTLKECQPYAFLPADRYKEWKVLDLSFSPRDMAGG